MYWVAPTDTTGRVFWVFPSSTAQWCTGWFRSFCIGMYCKEKLKGETDKHFVYFCWNSFQGDNNLLQCYMDYPVCFLLARCAGGIWKIPHGNLWILMANNWYGGLQLKSLCWKLVIKAFWCWAVPSKLMGDVVCAVRSDGLRSWRCVMGQYGFPGGQLLPKAVWNGEVALLSFLEFSPQKSLINEVLWIFCYKWE